MRRVFDPIDPSDTRADRPGSAPAPRHGCRATELQRRGSRLHHSDLGAVLVTEEGDGAHPLGFLQRGLGRVDRGVAEHGEVGQLEHPVQLLRRRLPMMREVEAQPVRRHQRSLLAHVVTQHRPQAGVQQVGGGVIAPDGLAPLAVDGGPGLLAHHQLAVDPGLVHHQAGQRVDRVEHVGDAGLGHDGPGVTHLPAALGVEGGLVQEDLDHVALAVAIAVAAGRQHADHLRRDLVVGSRPPHERGRARRIEQRPIGRGVARLLGRGGRPGPLALFGHGQVELRTGRLHDPGVAGQLLGQLDREAVGVVQGEGHVPLQHLVAGGERLLQPA